MDNKIFELGLSVEAISLYLLLDALIAAETPLNMANVHSRWNATEEMLSKSIAELQMNDIIQINGQEFVLNPVSNWTETKKA
ncbi:hypothetical protein KFV02_02515 [Desulfohalobiaceae bacterium Ax17]|jgi:hypothetical protein|uniref:hypothetical protein n=1 Tax=Desulfovulcanus ferrireducens TaxID=2831190 RepID=UPI00207BC189|nr:hypothetical protein [Desulfovulcanus ferrireducens]MBT8762801.1 hypothetical protein [Desulfovulcanus ferrireducens]